VLGRSLSDRHLRLSVTFVPVEAKVARVRELDAVSDPEALTGAMIAGGFGIAWALGVPRD